MQTGVIKFTPYWPNAHDPLDSGEFLVEQVPSSFVIVVALYIYIYIIVSFAVERGRIWRVYQARLCALSERWTLSFFESKICLSEQSITFYQSRDWLRFIFRLFGVDNRPPHVVLHFMFTAFPGTPTTIECICSIEWICFICWFSLIDHGIPSTTVTKQQRIVNNDCGLMSMSLSMSVGCSWGWCSWSRWPNSRHSLVIAPGKHPRLAFSLSRARSLTPSSTPKCNLSACCTFYCEQWQCESDTTARHRALLSRPRTLSPIPLSLSPSLSLSLCLVCLVYSPLFASSFQCVCSMIGSNGRVLHDCDFAAQNGARYFVASLFFDAERPNDLHRNTIDWTARRDAFELYDTMLALRRQRAGMLQATHSIERLLLCRILLFFILFFFFRLLLSFCCRAVERRREINCCFGIILKNRLWSFEWLWRGHDIIIAMNNDAAISRCWIVLRRYSPTRRSTYVVRRCLRTRSFVVVFVFVDRWFASLGVVLSCELYKRTFRTSAHAMR